MISRYGEHVQRRKACGFPSLVGVVFPAQTAYELRFMPDNRQNPTKIKQVACLDTFNISPKRSRRRRQLNTELRKPALRASRLRPFRAHHLPECAPPSTCSTSPVTWRASV